MPSLRGSRSDERQQEVREERKRASGCSPRSADSLSDLDALEELVNLLIAQLLAQRREYVSQLAHSDVSSILTVKYGEATDEFLCSGRDGKGQEA